MSIKLIRRSFIFNILIFAALIVVMGSHQESSFAATPQQSAPYEVIESDKPVVTRDGDWTFQSTDSASGGGYLYTSGAETDTLTLEFYGTSVEIGYVAGPHFGDFAIEIDNVIVRSVVTTDDDTQFDQHAVVNYLEEGNHTLRIIPISGAIAIDAFYTTLPEGASVDIPAGYIIIQGDIMVPADFLERMDDEGRTEAFASNLWPNGEVPYQFEPEVTTENQAKMRAAMDDWEALAPVTFTHCPSNSCAMTYFIRVRNSDIINSSHLGYGYAEHYVSIISWDTHAIIMHELAHTLGIWHEQQRTDRDTYVEIVFDNIDPENAFNFDLEAETGKYGAYDFASIMHYNGCAFAITACPPNYSIRVKPPYEDQQSVLGQRVAATELDGEEVRHIYAGAITQAPTLSNPPSVDSTPTITWNTVDNGTLYQIYMSNSTSTVLNKVFTTVETGCTGGGNCSYTFPEPIPYGCYTVWMKASNHHYTSDWGSSNFCISLPPLPGTATPTAPTGGISDNPPTFTWGASTNGRWYHFVLKKGQTTITDTWLNAINLGCDDGVGTCTYPSEYMLDAGNYSWWLQPYNDSGLGSWTGATNFTQNNGILPAGVVASISPYTTIDLTNAPHFTWSPDPWATWYHLWVGNSSGAVLDKWYTAEEACDNGASFCRINQPVELANGSYYWHVHGWNRLGSGPWNGATTFGIDVPYPTAPTIQTPSGTINNPIPTITWLPVDTATQYLVVLGLPDGTTIQETLTPATANCPPTSSPCSATLNTPLASSGNHTVWIRAHNGIVWGNWSAGKSFTYIPAAATPVTLVSPSGLSPDHSPTFSWVADPAASWYHIIIQDLALPAPDIDVWKTATAVNCHKGAGTCSYTTPYTHGAGNYIWWVQSYSPAGSAWSAGSSFQLGLANGFDSQFTNDTTNWQVGFGPWANDNLYYFTQDPAPGSWISVYYDQNYTNFDYQARLWTLGCDYCATSILVRGTPTPLQTENIWNTGYLFSYSREGSFSVFRLNGASAETTLQAWTPSAAINKGDAWNTLRVIAVNNRLNFYINDILVWTGTDSTYTSGVVGFGFYNDGGKNLWTDWATLSDINDPLSPSETVSAEQQALNDAANREESTHDPNRSRARTDADAVTSGNPPPNATSP